MSAIILLLLSVLCCTNAKHSQTAPLSSNVQFCTPTLDLAVGDNFNIRDFVVDVSNPATQIDWSSVSFFYSDNATSWHIDDFRAGKNVLLGFSDINSYDISVQGNTTNDVSMCNIRVWSSGSQLAEALLDPGCGIARGSILSEIITETDPGAIPGGQFLKFCVYSITLTIGDVFNIRDTVVNMVNPAAKIDWTNVVFYYSDNTIWHVNDFSTGTPFVIQESDFGKGNRGADQFRVAMRDMSGSDSTLNIKLNRSISSSEMSKLMQSSTCGYARIDLRPINFVERSFPMITTVTFDYAGQTVPNMAGFVADLMGLPLEWVQLCPQQTLRVECVQFFDNPINGTEINTKLWADRMLLYINFPQANDTYGQAWAHLSRANITGISSLNNFQPLTFNAYEENAKKAKATLSVGLLVIGILVILSILVVISVFVWKIRTRPHRV